MHWIRLTSCSGNELHFQRRSILCLVSCSVLMSEILLSHLPARAASFDCEKAVSSMEKIICGDPKLSELDSKLLATYKSALSQAQDADALRLQQRSWVKSDRDPLEYSLEKLYSVYIERIAELESSHSYVYRRSEKCNLEMYYPVMEDITNGGARKKISKVVADFAEAQRSEWVKKCDKKTKSKSSDVDDKKKVITSGQKSDDSENITEEKMAFGYCLKRHKDNTIEVEMNSVFNSSGYCLDHKNKTFSFNIETGDIIKQGQPTDKTIPLITSPIEIEEMRIKSPDGTLDIQYGRIKNPDKVKSYQKINEDIMSSVERDQREYAENKKMKENDVRVELSTRHSIEQRFPELIVRSSGYSADFGGAHGLDGITQTIWDVKTAEIVTVGDIFGEKSSFASILAAYAEKYSSGSGETPTCDEYPDVVTAFGKMNCSLGKDKFVCHINKGEVVNAWFGPFVAEVPYSVLKPIMTPRFANLLAPSVTCVLPKELPTSRTWDEP